MNNNLAWFDTVLILKTLRVTGLNTNINIWVRVSNENV
jgi:hypothetical protein